MVPNIFSMFDMTILKIGFIVCVKYVHLGDAHLDLNYIIFNMKYFNNQWLDM